MDDDEKEMTRIIGEMRDWIVDNAKKHKQVNRDIYVSSIITLSIYMVHCMSFKVSRKDFDALIDGIWDTVSKDVESTKSAVILTKAFFGK